MNTLNFHAVNLHPENDDDLFAPVIYTVDDRGNLAEVYRSWQRPNGRSASGNLKQDRAEALAMMADLARQ